MAKTKFENFEESLKKGDLEGVKKNFKKNFLEKVINNFFYRDLRPIHWACLKGDINIAKFLIDHKCNIESENENKWRPIHFACWFGSVEKVKLLIDQKCNIESENNDKWRPIHIACRYGSVEMVKLLIDQKCNIESETNDKWRPIHHACQYGSIEMVKLLVDKKCSIESENKNKYRPIHFACQYGSVEMVKLFIDQKCNVESEIKEKWRPIHIACRYGTVEMVKLLVDQKCNLESDTDCKWRPIHHACLSGHFETVRLLFALRCQIDVRNESGQTPLDMARLGGHNEIVNWIERFIKKNSEICESITNDDLEAFIKHCTNETSMILDTKSEIPWLEIVFEKKPINIIKFLIDQQIHPLDIDTIRIVVDKNITLSLNYQLWEEVLLYKCIRDQNLKGFQLLCRPIVINRQRKLIPSSFLETAAEHGSYVIVDEILKKSIFDVESWKRAKTMALEKGHNEIAESISMRESLLKCRQQADLSILHSAVCDNDPEMVEYILKDGNLVDPNHNNEILGTALALAILLCNEKCLSVLKQFNVNCDTRNKYLQTPLHEAISNGLIEHCQYLIDRTKCIDEAGFMGQTALHCAVMRGCEELCDELVKKGADCMGYMEVFHHSINKKDPLSLTKRENALTLCAKINKTIYPCFLQLLDTDKANSCDDEGNSLIHLTASLLNKDLCKSLIAKGGNVNSINKCENSPLFEMLSKMDKETFDKNEEKVIEIVYLFIDSKCNINQRFRENLTIFDIALQFECERLLLSLVPPPKPNEILEVDEYLLKIALENKYFRFCEVLLYSEPQDQFERYINSDMINIALLNDQRNLVKSLVILSSLNVKDSMMGQVLYHFANLKDEEAFKWLLDLEIENPGYLENGETLLTELLKERKTIFYQKIVHSEENIKKYINLKNKKRQTPLQVSIETESMKMVNYFSFETQDLDNEDNEGQTALMQLFEKLSNNIDENRSIEFMNAIKTIINVGGNIYHKTQNGVNIIEYCSPPKLRQEIENYFLAWKQKKVTVEKEDKSKITCEICMDREVDSAFDCGHTICRICSDKIVKCPFCGFEPARPKRIYLG